MTGLVRLRTMPNMASEREIIDGLLEDAEAALARGAVEKARSLYQGILVGNPDNVTALRQLGGLEANTGDPARALALFEHARNVGPMDPDLCHDIATTLRLMGRPALASSALTAALNMNPRHAPALYDRALELQQRGKFDEARETYQKLSSIGITHFDTWFNTGVVLYRMGNLVAAERWFHAASHIDPKSPKPFINLAMVYRAWGFVKEAVGCLEHALTLAPDNPDIHWNLANALLVSGDFARGFAEYEWRFRRPGRGERPMTLPRWGGEVLDGKTILLTLEQGLGDAIHFIRFAANVAARGGRVVVECQPTLRTLLATAPGVAATVDPGAAVPDAVCYAPLMSLPHILGVTLEALPPCKPYLSVPSGTKVFDIPAKALRVGLVWRGNPQHEHDQWRSVPLSLLQPLLEVPGVAFFGLQVGEGGDEAARGPWKDRVTDLTPHLTDFSATAAAVAALDLVISVDTAVAHLAGALGKPVCMLIAQGNDWRWLHERVDSPWYPTLRLYRQRRRRNWGPAIRELTRDVAAAVAARPKTA